MRLSSQFLTFCVIGLINTAVDTAIFVSLREAEFSILIANIISTSFGLAISLALNYRYTFKSTQRLGGPTIGLYIAVTLIGLWVLQPLTIALLIHINSTVDYIGFVSRLIGDSQILYNVIPKLGSIGITLIWNYLWYSRVIFKNSQVALRNAISNE